MRRGTTPTHTFTLPFEVEMIKSVQVVYKQDGVIVLAKKTEDCTLSGNAIAYKLTQQESLAFHDSKNVEIQVRVLLQDGNALASDIMGVYVSRCLDDEVIE